MRDVGQLIGKYHSAFVICGGLACLFLAVAVALFFRFRILAALGEVSGRTARKAVRKMKKGLLLLAALTLLCQAGQARAEEGEEEAVQESVRVEARWMNEDGEELLEDDVYQDGEVVYLELRLLGGNLDAEHTRVELSAADYGGMPVDCPEAEAYGERQWEEGQELLCMELRTEANYEVSVVVAERVKQETEEPEIPEEGWEEEPGEPEEKEEEPEEEEEPEASEVIEERRVFLGKVCLDRTPPRLEAEDIVCRAEKQSFLEKLINGVSFGYFCQPVMSVRIQAADEVSGVAAITYRCGALCDEEGQELESMERTVSLEEGTLTEEEAGSCAFVELTLPQSLKGKITARARDRAGHEMESFTESRGLLAESEALHRNTSRAEVGIVSGEGKKPGFYRGDVEVCFEAEDTFSGLADVEFEAGSWQETESYREPGTELVTECRRTRVVSAEEENRNEVPLSVLLTDLAGHQTQNAEMPPLHLDVNAPQIEVSYDNLEVYNEKYYQAARTATIAVTERNFDPEDVELTLEGRSVPVLSWMHQGGSGCKGSSDPSDLGHSDSCRWLTQVSFEEDGEYRLGFACTDAAGNRGSLGRTDEFVIDKTAPVLEVTFDRCEALHEKYYNQARTATIHVTEKNFRAQEVETAITASDRGERIASPAVGGFAENGEEHWAEVRFGRDGVYQMRVEYVDLAGNRAKPVEVDAFVIDQTPPELTFFGVGDHSANNASVRPGVRSMDTNCDLEALEVVLKGSNRGRKEAESERSRGEDWVSVKLDDFACVPENDDLYCMTASALDLAGNQRTGELWFSVNRFGSVYVLDEATEALAGSSGSRMTNREQDLVIEEYNVDLLLERQVRCSRNGEVVTLLEDRDFTVQETEDAASWKRYVYHIGKKNFAREGAYVVTVSSRDRAENRSSNQSREKSMEFVMDKTPPSIVLTGVEAGGRYEAAGKTVLADIKDNLSLEAAEFYLNGSRVKVCGREELLESQGLVNCQIPEKRERQILCVYAKDAAGNERFTEPVEFVVSTEREKTSGGGFWILAAAGGMIFCGALAAGFLFFKKKQEKEKKILDK